LSQDRGVGHEDLKVPEYAAAKRTPREVILGRVSDAPLREGNRIALLKNGTDTYEDWLAAIARTERWIHHVQADLRMGRVSEDPTPEQRTALARIETALHTYLSYFYPHDARE
jgi:hypothetical protein